MASEIRLYLRHPLTPGQTVPLDRGQAHYLTGVMRKGPGTMLEVFNGQDGSFSATITQIGKKTGSLQIGPQRAPLQLPPDLWLLFAPIKKARTDFIVEKAAEMGVRHIQPVQTDFTNAERLRSDRLQAHAVEAAEQCGGNFVPEVHALIRLDRLLAQWDPARHILFCDEALTAAQHALPVKGRSDTPWAILIGPEGGFSDTERSRLSTLSCVHRVSLGPRILRADTAAVAALTLWQSQLGDWV